MHSHLWHSELLNNLINSALFANFSTARCANCPFV